MSMLNIRFKFTGMTGFLTRLRRDRRGNTLVLVAAMMVPLAGVVGGGLDMGRLYATKTRLQHACDAGALAGRKAMGAGNWSNGDYAARTAARQFFDGNFSTGAFGSDTVVRDYSENAGKVTGTASARVPMTLMKIFGKSAQTLAVTCDADMRLPNTDIMFVLDTTGSMADPQPGDTVNKITALKTAVKCFYEIVARLDTDAVCATGTPSGGTGNQVQIRFGFVPYATNVNVGKLLKPEWFADSWDYQTRRADTPYQTDITEQKLVNPDPRGDWRAASDQGSGYCNSRPVPADSDFVSRSAEGPEVEKRTSGDPPVTTWVTYQYGYVYTYRRATSGWDCFEQRQVFGDLRRQYRSAPTFRGWVYDKLPVNVALLKNGAGWNNSFQWPIASGGSNRTIDWDGCIEERQTVRATSFSPIPADAKDLDIDTVPSDAATRWGMVLPDLIFTRNGSNGWSRAASTTATNYGNQSYYACPTEARLLQSWSDPVGFSAYVDSLKPEGNTYHDIGLIWGARLMSPTGLFKADNAMTPKGGDIERHMIFMTDGDACTHPDNYTAYGVQWFDRRQTPEADVPTGGCTSNDATLTQQVNLRTEALCAAIQNKKITLWVVAFGNLATETETRLKACATAGRYFKATKADELQKTFKAIADQISMLRLTS